jgi:glycosyltransferase involved in cell wall biosynthesis
MPAISIIMPCYNSAHELARTLGAYDNQVGVEDFELIAIDDGSTDDTHAVLTSYQPRRFTLRVEHTQANQGPAAARNLGVAKAAAPLILIVGADILPAEKLVWGHMVAHKINQQPEYAILGRVEWPFDLPVNTLMTHIDGVGAQQFSYYYLRDGQEYDFRHFYTSNISIKAGFLKSTDHWFDVEFPFAAFEDAELAYRLSKKGLKIRYCAGITGYHYHYHTIWTFSKRQRKAGMMACLLTAKHPGLRYQFREQYLRIARLLKHPKAILSDQPIQRLAELEEMTCHLLSYYEWNPNSLLDRLYSSVLDYFYYDGVVEGLFGSSKRAQRLRTAHAQVYIVPALKWYFTEAARMQIPVVDPSRLEWLNLYWQ